MCRRQKLRLFAVKEGRVQAPAWPPEADLGLVSGRGVVGVLSKHSLGHQQGDRNRAAAVARTVSGTMSVWVPPAMPATLEEMWLPQGHNESSINPYLVSCLEEALEKRRNDVRDTPAPMAMGTHRAMVFRPAGDDVRGSPRQDDGIDEDEDMDVGREEDDEELASDEISDDGGFGTPRGDVDGDDDMDDLEDSDADDEDDLASFL